MQTPRRCQFCAEPIQAAAVVCPHCRRTLSVRDRKTALIVVLSVVAALGLLTVVSLIVLALRVFP